MKISELFENNRAPLYHNTTRNRARKIIAAGEIKTFADDKIDPEISMSLTRDQHYGEKLYGPVKFEIDTNKLRNTHKITPVDFDRQNSIDNNNPNPPIRQEREERVRRPIPLKYVAAVRDNDTEFDPNFAEKIINSGIPYFYKNKSVTKADLPKTDYTITDPGLTYFDTNQKITADELKQAIQTFGKNSFSYKPQ